MQLTKSLTMDGTMPRCNAFNINTHSVMEGMLIKLIKKSEISCIIPQLWYHEGIIPDYNKEDQYATHTATIIRHQQSS
jgi:hypothetical protein